MGSQPLIKDTDQYSSVLTDILIIIKSND